MLILALIVLLVTAMWPLNRRAMRRGARPEAVEIAMRRLVGVTHRESRLH